MRAGISSTPPTRFGSGLAQRSAKLPDSAGERLRDAVQRALNIIGEPGQSFVVNHPSLDLRLGQRRSRKTGR